MFERCFVQLCLQGLGLIFAHLHDCALCDPEQKRHAAVRLGCAD